LRSLGGHLRDGEKGSIVQYWSWRQERSLLDERGRPVRDDTGEARSVITEFERPRVIPAVVFNAEQANGLPPPSGQPAPEGHAGVDAILARLGAAVHYKAGRRPSYDRRSDTIILPVREAFETEEALGRAALRAAAHATGHLGRLGRDLDHPVGSAGHARESLRVGLACLFLGDALCVGYDPDLSSAAIAHWIRLLRNDAREIFRAAADADAIVRYLAAPMQQIDVERPNVAGVSSSGRSLGAQIVSTRAEAAIHIAVPFAEKDEAKALGARWDREAQSWYIPTGAELTPFTRWQRLDLHRALRDEARDPREAFAEALREAGLIVDQGPEMDGRLHRVPVKGDKRGARSGAYVGYLDGRPAGFIQNFKTGETRLWKAERRSFGLSDAERRRLQHEIEARRAARQAHAETIHAETVALLRSHLQTMEPAPNRHPYLVRKRIGAHGAAMGVDRTGPLMIAGGEAVPQAWSGKGNLILPLTTIAGELIGAQAIGVDGRKTFARGGHLRGGMYWLGGEEGREETIVIAEGYATAATIHELTGFAVATAFTAGNLEAVALACRERYGGATIYIAGDNDHRLAREQGPDGRPKANVGRLAAERAAMASGGIAMLPQFEAEDPGSDWNDVMLQKGRPEVDRQWTALTPRTAHDRQETPQIGAGNILPSHSQAAETEQSHLGKSRR
jgi:phage/plasmid primase-like uncharacterized protein/antirestriction protein ArdC